jgi:hypothetical protein
MLKIGTNVIIVENLSNYDDYEPGTVARIVDIDLTDGYYFLDIGYCVSDREIEVV